MSILRRCLGSTAIIAWLACACGSAAAADLVNRPSGYSLLTPEAGQFEIDSENLSGFIGPGSIVRVREFQTEGTGLHFPALGINTVQLPSIGATYWFNQLNAFNFQFRYFDVGGNHFSASPVFFNGSTIAGGQTLHTDPSVWLSLGFFYERRLTPLFERYQTSWPPFLQGWDVRGKIGIEYTYLNFTINGGHAPVTATSKGEETKEDFFHQELPIPTIALELLHGLGENFAVDAFVKGNWINRWNSLRNEGGTVWLSQNGVESHLRVLYSNRTWLGPIHPMIGIALYYYSQLEDSHEDGNFIRWFTYGPEYGVQYLF